jgi:hypothetical protein
MDFELIPGLTNAVIFGGDKEIALFNNKPIPSEFRAFFAFYEDSKPLKTWDIKYSICITDQGTPVLMSVEVNGSFAVSVDFKITQDFNLREPDKFKPTKSQNGQIKSKEVTNPNNRESVQRWQLKIAEQYRFQLLEIALLLAVTNLKRMEENGVAWWRFEQQPFSMVEINKLRKSIATKIRQKITPDFLKGVARIYTEAALRGEKPIKAVQETYDCSYRTAQDYAIKAREIGLLPETSPGKVTVVAPKKAKKAAPKKTTVGKEKK